VGQLAARLGKDIEETAEAILNIATSHIYATLVPLLARKGVDYSDYALLPFGGAGPMHGLLVARDIGVRKVIVPLHPGVLCAVGALVADVRRDFVRTIHQRFRPTEGADVVAAMEKAYGVLERQGSAWLDEQRLNYERRRFSRIADMRYHGQSFEITVDLNDVDLTRSDAALVAAFQAEYEKVYGYANAGAVLEVRDVRLVAIGETPKPRIEMINAADDRGQGGPPCVGAVKTIFHDGCHQEARFLNRAHVRPGRAIAGPAIIAQYDATTFVPAGYTVTADKFGNLIAEVTHVGR
jgi:N-methylhydantoinase A